METMTSAEPTEARMDRYPASDTKRIVVADDDDVFRMSIAALIESWGFDVECVSTGNEIEPFLRDDWPDVVLADVRMPGNSELECLEMLRVSKASASLILMTGYPNVTTATRSFGLGATNYLVKPIDEDSLRESLEKGIGQAVTSRQIARLRAHVREFDDTLERIAEDKQGVLWRESRSPVQDVFGLIFGGFISTLADLTGEAGRQWSESLENKAILSSPRAYPGQHPIFSEPGHRNDLDQLSPREREVLECLLSGQRVPTIAKQLFIAENTVRNHLKSIFDKVGVRSQVDLIEHFTTRN